MYDILTVHAKVKLAKVGSLATSDDPTRKLQNWPQRNEAQSLHLNSQVLIPSSFTPSPRLLDSHFVDREAHVNTAVVMPALRDLLPAVVAAIPPSLPTVAWVLVPVRPSFSIVDRLHDIG